MHALIDIHTPFHIDFGWWSSRQRNLGRFLATILGEDDAATDGGEPIDVIDPLTAEVFQVDRLWARVVVERAVQPDYITPATPMANAVLRALIAGINRPMSALELHRRIDRGSPETVLKVLRAARIQYGIVPLAEAGSEAEATASARAKAPAKAKAKAGAKTPASKPAASQADASAPDRKAPARSKAPAKPKAASKA